MSLRLRFSNRLPRDMSWHLLSFLGIPLQVLLVIVVMACDSGQPDEPLSVNWGLTSPSTHLLVVDRGAAEDQKFSVSGAFSVDCSLAEYDVVWSMNAIEEWTDYNLSPTRCPGSGCEIAVDFCEWHSISQNEWVVVRAHALEAGLLDSSTSCSPAEDLQVTEVYWVVHLVGMCEGW